MMPYAHSGENEGSSGLKARGVTEQNEGGLGAQRRWVLAV